MSEMAGEVLALAEALSDERFAKVDIELRRGRHIHRDELDAYEYLSNAKPVLDAFYRRYSCELVHRSDGYFFLLPSGDLLPRRAMSLAEMIVGQGLALCYLDPALLASGGLLSKDELLSTLASAMGNDSLMRAFNPRKKRLDERIAQRTVRQRVSEALRRLAGLGFITLHEGEKVQLHASLMRFAEPVRGAGSAAQAMRRLLASGEVSQGEEDANEPDEGKEPRQSSEDEAEAPEEQFQSAEDETEGAEEQSESAERETEVAENATGEPREEREDDGSEQGVAGNHDGDAWGDDVSEPIPVQEGEELTEDETEHDDGR